METIQEVKEITLARAERMGLTSGEHAWTVEVSEEPLDNLPWAPIGAIENDEIDAATKSNTVDKVATIAFANIFFTNDLAQRSHIIWHELAHIMTFARGLDKISVVQLEEWMADLIAELAAKMDS